MFANLSNKNTLKIHFSIIRSNIKVAVSNYRSYSCWMRFQVTSLGFNLADGHQNVFEIRAFLFHKSFTKKI
jgi:hypothetical protein